MKNLSSFIAASILLIAGCKSNRPVSSTTKVQSQKIGVDNIGSTNKSRTEPYKQVLPQARFTTSYKRGESEPLFNAQELNDFIVASGLPVHTMFNSWLSNHNKDEALQLYSSYIHKNKDHKYINYFKQYAGWMLVTHLDMLSKGNGSPSTHLQLILDNLIESKYQGYDLLYYNLQYLKDNSLIAIKDIGKYASSITSYANTEISVNNINNIDTTGLSPATMRLVKKSLEEKNRKEEWLIKIRGLE